MTFSARTDCAVRRPPAANFGATSLAIGFLALLYVAPLSAQGAKSLLDLLINPQAQDMPPLVRAASDGTMLDGHLIVQTIPRITLAAHHGDKMAPADPQRLAAASPDIVAPARIEASRLPSHFLTTENQTDRALLDAIFAGKIPAYFQNIEPAANAPKVDFVKPAPLLGNSALAAVPFAPDLETSPTPAALPVLTALTRPDGLKLAKAYLLLPPPPITLPAVKPQTVPAVTQDLTALNPVTQDLTALNPETQDLTALSPVAPETGLAAIVPPVIKGETLALNTPNVGTIVDALPGTIEPTQPLVPLVPDLTGKDLNRALQAELKRLNCLNGKADGSFGKGSQGALDLFFQTTRLTRASADLSQAVLDQLQAVADNACASPYAPPVQAQVVAPTTKPATSKPAKATVPAQSPKATAPAKPAKPAKAEDPCVKNPASCMSFN